MARPLTISVNNDAWRRMQQRIVEIGTKQVRFGILGDGKLATVFATHEYGSPARGIPERSSLRSTMREKERELGQHMAKVTRAYVAQRVSVNQALGLVGAWCANAVKFKIGQGPPIPPPLSPRTIARKGSTRPLVNTGRMMNSIRWVVVD